MVRDVVRIVGAATPSGATRATGRAVGVGGFRLKPPMKPPQVSLAAFSRSPMFLALIMPVSEVLEQVS